MLFRSRRQRLQTVGRLPDHQEVRLGGQPADQSAAHDRVVVHDQHPGGHRAGTRTVTRVPRPGTDATSTAPHTCSARSRSPASPTPDATDGSNPTPSSSTCTDTCADSPAPTRLTRSTTDVADACRRTLASASW